MPMPVADISGRRFGRWNVYERSTSNAAGKVYWRCVCACGTEKAVRGSHLLSGRSTNCGCTRYKNVTKHGYCHHPLYDVWSSMKKRCSETCDPRYIECYYGRGIRVCQEWLNSPKAFIDWALSHGYSAGLQIDRKDNDGHYSPDNCRFVTSKVNNNNRRPRRPKNAASAVC